jgi:hypothetical protein
MADEKTKASGLNGSKYYPNTLSSLISPESNFDLSLLFQNI